MTSDDDESSDSEESNSEDDLVLTHYSSSKSLGSDFKDNSKRNVQPILLLVLQS